MSIASQDIFDPLKQDVDPLLQDLFAAINQAAQIYLAKSAATASLAPVAGIVADLGLQAATVAVNQTLKITPAAAAPPA